MVAIVAGNGLGLLNTSLNTIGAAGVLGESVLGQGDSHAFVNVVNGNLVLQAQDAQLAGRGADLFALRTYNSLGAPTDGDEDGWRWGYEQTVRFQGPGTPLQPGPGATVLRTDGDGHETAYTWDTARVAYVATEGSGAHEELRYDGAASEWVWTHGSLRVTERYSNSTAPAMTGRVVRCTDSSANSIAFAYDSGRLTLIQDTGSQQELRLSYGQFNGVTRARRLEARALTDNADGRATATLGNPLQLVEYDYDNQGRLITVSQRLTPNGSSGGDSFVTTYDYDASSIRIAGFTHSDGTGLSFSYDTGGRVSSIKDRNGATGAQLTFVYGPQPNRTAVTDGNGQVWTYRHDATTGQLTEIVTPPVGNTGLSTTFQYDVADNLVGITDPQSNVLTYGYDGSGNRVFERDAVGSTTTRTFSPLNQMLTETRYRVADPDGAGPQAAGDPFTTRYVYDANARLRFLVSAEGRVTENRYGSPTAGYGLLTQTLLYVGQLYDVIGLGPGQQLTESELDDWVAGLPDRTQVQITEYSYDLRGNMSQQTSYATVGTIGAGVLDGQASVTEYAYDAHSQLRQRIAVRGSARNRRTVVASFAYDGLTRVLNSSGANGLQTTVYDDANRRIAVTRASGLTETRDYDTRGRLVNVIQTGDGTTRRTRYVYDNADRPRMVEDAQGGRRYRFYDTAGRLEFKVDATGAVTRFENNAAGQLVRQTQYLNRVDTGSWYDSAAGTVTKSSLRAGGAGGDVTLDATHDRVTAFDYDGAGRLTASTDAVGTVTTVSYDGLSRVVMTQTGERVTRYLYDKDNRRVGIVDALGYLTEYKYDAGGRLIETVRCSQRSPAAANMTAPVWIGVTQQTVVVGRPFEHRVLAYDADGDPLTLSVVGAAPAWLSFDADTATLRGTPPTTPTTDSITLRADDGRGKTSDVTVLFTVTNAATAAGGKGAGPAWVPLSPLDAVANTPVSYFVPAAVGQSLTYSTVSGLPPGLAFDAATLAITGSSSAIGLYSILLRVTNANDQSTERTLSVRIRTAATTPAQLIGSDQASAWRPADTGALHSYLYYDGQGRVVGAVDEQQFLTETVYDDALNRQKTLRYPTPVAVASGDNLASLKSSAGASRQISLVQYDDFGRVSEVTGLDGSTVTRNEYDGAGRLTRVVSAANTNEERVRCTFYNAFGEVTATLGGEGSAWLGTNPSAQRIAEAVRDYGIRHEYDTLGRMVRSVDANGNKTLFYYDRENRLTHTVNIIGQTTDNSLAGEVSETAYNSFGQAISVRRYAARLAAADMTQLLSDGGGGLAGLSLLGKLTALGDASSDQVSLYEYDRAGRRVKQVDGESGFTETIYNAYGELAAQVRSTREGQTTVRQIDYDLNGRVVSQTGDAGGINANTRTEYDAFGRVIRAVDGTGRATTTAYPDSGRSIVVTDPLQRATRTEYDALGRVSHLTNALGQQTVNVYDEATRSVTMTTPESRQVTTTRTRHGQILSVTDGRGNLTRYGFNRDGQPTTVTDALGRMIVQTTYDKSGRQLEVTDARGTVTRFAYDQRDRVFERRVDPTGLNLSTLFAFDALGQQIAVTEAAGTAAQRVTTYGYDRKGRTMTVVVDGSAGGLQLCTTYGYDDLDNVVAVAHGTASSPNRHVILYEFDTLGRRVKEIGAPSSVFGPGAPDRRDLTTQYRYDANGRLSRRIDANGQSTWQVYDAAGQLTFSISALGEVSESRYDAAGRLAYSHRYFERLVPSTISGFGDVIPALAAPAATPNDQRSHVVYDGDGRPRFSLKATGAPGWVVGEDRHDANGNVIEVRAYDRFLPEARVAAIDSASSPGITVQEIEEELRITLGYHDDDPGTLVGVQRTFFAYDAANRPRFTVDPSGSVMESVYDAAGNVVASVGFAVRPTLVEHTEVAIDAAVDRGKPDNRVTRQAFDAANRLRYTIDALGSVSEKEYDARGNVIKSVRWASRPALTQHTENAIAAALAAMPPADNDPVMRLVYDAGNRLRFTIDAMGSVSENAFDEVDNVLATTRFAQRPTPPPTTFTEAAINAAVQSLRGDVENQVTGFAYDAAKRLRFAVDTAGSVTESVYDANGNLLATTPYAARPTLAQVDEGTIAAAVAPLQADPRNRVTRFACDAQNRLRFTVDALGSVSERVYDGLGNLTGTERFVVRPPLAQYTESAIDAAVGSLRGHPGNRLEHHLHDALGRGHFDLLRLSLEGGQAKYHVTAQELNALGQSISSTAYATAVALGSVSEAAIAAAVGNGDPSRDSVVRFVYDLGGRQIYRLKAVTVEGDRRKYRVSAQRFDALGQAVGSTDYATPVALVAFDEASVDAAVQAVADQARDRVSAIAFDALGQANYSVRVLGQGSHQVVKQEYDALGLVFKTTQYASGVGPLVSFDRATIDAAVNAVAGENDRKVRYVRDAAGRQRFVLQADKSGQWTIGESRYNAVGNLVESRRYDRYVTDAWIASADAARPTGLGEQDVIGQLAVLGYDDATPASLANIQRSRFAYDTQNRLRFTIDALGSVTENVYDALGDLTTTVRFAAPPAPAQYTERAIDAAVDRDDAANRVQHLAYDALGQLRFNVQVIEPNVGSVGKHWIDERRYDTLGQLVESRGYATTVGHLNAYDETTLVASVLIDVANDRRSAVAYDAGGRQVFAVRELRVGSLDRYVVTKQFHDALDQLVQRIDYASPVALAQFDADSVDGAVVAQPGNDRTTTFVRDAAGRLRFEIRPDLSFRESQYDALDQLTQTTQFDFAMPSNAPRTEAEMVARRGNHTVGDGVTRGQVHAWDAGGRLTSTGDALGNTERYEYDALGGCLRWTDKNGNSFACAYDRRGRKTAETTPPLKFKLRGEAPATPAPDRVIETRFEYDAFGNLVRKIEAVNFANNASTTDFVFDTVGRPTATLYNGFHDPASGTVETTAAAGRFRREATITYDPLGNAVRASSRTGVDAFDHTWRTYDSQGRVVHEINVLNHVTRYGYNTSGEQKTVTRYSVTISGTPQNGVYWTAAEVDSKLNWGRDENGNLIEDWAARTIRLDYDKLGRKSAVTMPTAEYYSTQMPGDPAQANYFRLTPASIVKVSDAAVTQYEYDAFGDVTRQRVRANTIVEWHDTSFTYDAMGRQTRSVDAAGNVTAMAYDAAGNLVRQEEPRPPVRFLQWGGWDRITEFSYNLLDQQTRVDRYGLRYTDANGVEHGVPTWTWKNGGEWLNPDAKVATTVRTATYDAYGRALAVTDAGGNVTSMRYDALGHLVQVTAPVCLVAPLDANGEDAVDPFRNQVSETLVTSITLDVFGRPVWQVRATSQGGDARETLQSYDAAGNLVGTTDAEGNVKGRAYDPAGRVIREMQAIHADLGPMGINGQGLERRYAYDALGQLTDTLDVYVDDTDLVQSGKSVLYNAFGEVVEERRKWGPASQDPAALNTALVGWYHYDNAGQVFEKVAADGLTVYFYNLLGQVTREEKRGKAIWPYEDPTRVTETEYDVLGRATMTRRPEFLADVTPQTGGGLVIPYLFRDLDRWGNVRGTEEGGYRFTNGQPLWADTRIFRSYLFDDSNRVVTESLGTYGYTSSAGVSTNALISKRIFRDLLGNVVKEVDEARDDSQAETLISSRSRAKRYDSVGRVIAETDATNRTVEYAYNLHGDRLATRNASGTVLFDRCDRNGNVRYHGVLRIGNSDGEYDSFHPTGTIVRTYLNAYLYDQANRRYASKTFTEAAASAPWSYTWLDGRNLGIQHRDAMGIVTVHRFDPFGNKSVEIDGAGIRTEWNAATADYDVGRIDTYWLPTDTGIPQLCSYGYNQFGELKVHNVGNARTEYARHRNGLVYQVTTTPDVTHPVPNLTLYNYNWRGQLTSKGRWDSNSIQSTRATYDWQGRIAAVEDSKAPAAAGPICNVSYSYDEWSNIRRIQATYAETATHWPSSFDGWYIYDAAGNMTLSNGILSGGSIDSGIRIDYDTVGRRSGTSTPDPYAFNSPTGMRDERYEYDDLGHLLRIEQRLRDAAGELGTEWGPLSTRSCNLRGDVTQNALWTYWWAADHPPRVYSITTTAYRADGQVDWTKTDAVFDPNKSTETYNHYIEQTGQLDYYDFNALRSNGTPFTTTFKYFYTFQKGQRVVQRIRDIGNWLDTTKTYSGDGLLWMEDIELPRHGDGWHESRSYKYDPEGRVILTNASSVTPTPTDGQQSCVYAGDGMVAMVGVGSLAQTTKFDFAFMPVSAAGGSGASRYVVQSGNSLMDIALASYGDATLWYIIANANSVSANPGDPLPSTEIGKAYEIPDVIRSSQSASTFKPYAMREIIGNDRPIVIPAPPPPKISDWQLLAVAAGSIIVQVGATVLLSPIVTPALAAGIGAGLGNLAGQATAWELGLPGQHGIDWGSVVMGAEESLAGSMAGPGLYGALFREFFHQGITNYESWTSHETGVSPAERFLIGIAGSLFNVGADVLAPKLAPPETRRRPDPDIFADIVAKFEPSWTRDFNVAELINSAFNPSSGWAIPGSGKNPTVGFFGSFLGGAANMGFRRIRDQLQRPSPPRPPSVDAKRPLPPELIDYFDAVDRQQVQREDAAAITAESRERRQWLAKMSVLRDRIAHLGEGNDDRAIIRAVRRQMNAERERAEAIARSRQLDRRRWQNAEIAKRKAAAAKAQAQPNVQMIVVPGTRVKGITVGPSVYQRSGAEGSEFTDLAYWEWRDNPYNYLQPDWTPAPWNWTSDRPYTPEPWIRTPYDAQKELEDLGRSIWRGAFNQIPKPALLARLLMPDEEVGEQDQFKFTPGDYEKYLERVRGQLATNAAQRIAEAAASPPAAAKAQAQPNVPVIGLPDTGRVKGIVVGPTFYHGAEGSEFTDLAYWEWRDNPYNYLQPDWNTPEPWIRTPYDAEMEMEDLARSIWGGAYEAVDLAAWLAPVGSLLGSAARADLQIAQGELRAGGLSAPARDYGAMGYRVAGETTLDAKSWEIERYNVGMRRGGVEIGFVTYRDGRTPSVIPGDPSGVEIPVGPNIATTWHSHVDDSAIFSRLDIDTYEKGHFLPDTQHSVTALKWPETVGYLRSVPDLESTAAQLATETAMKTTTFTQSELDAGGARPDWTYRWLQIMLTR